MQDIVTTGAGSAMSLRNRWRLSGVSAGRRCGAGGTLSELDRECMRPP
jgi:hypothetical protein